MTAAPAHGPKGSDHLAPASRYNKWLAVGSWRLQQCRDCAAWQFPPGKFCGSCAGTSFCWQEPSGRASVYSTTVVRRPDDRGGPYNVCLIELEEGLRMMSRVVGLAPEAVQVGAAVVLSVSQTESGDPILLCRPQEGLK
jgi:uncharacterized OB-fold protein